MYPHHTLEMPLEYRSPYIELLLLMAGSDGDIVREELAVVESYMGKLMIHPDERAILRSKLESPRKYGDVIKDLDKPLLKLALRDSIVVGISDGVLEKKEIQFAKKLAKSGGVDEKTLSKICDWAIEGWDWHKKSASILRLDDVDST